MGVFAQTELEITCKDNKSAIEVYYTIQKKLKEDENYYYEKMEVDEEMVFIKKSSGRIQNLEYQCEILWELIKDIPGVIEMNAPFMMEADGKFFTNEK